MCYSYSPGNGTQIKLIELISAAVIYKAILRTYCKFPRIMNLLFGEKADSFYIYQQVISGPMKQSQKLPRNNHSLTANFCMSGFFHCMCRPTAKLVEGLYIFSMDLDINGKDEYITSCAAYRSDSAN